jgi:hypothetical protein
MFLLSAELSEKNSFITVKARPFHAVSQQEECLKARQ